MITLRWILTRLEVFFLPLPPGLGLKLNMSFIFIDIVVEKVVKIHIIYCKFDHLNSLWKQNFLLSGQESTGKLVKNESGGK
jgi:hypothetical protein